MKGDISPLDTLKTRSEKSHIESRLTHHQDIQQILEYECFLDLNRNMIETLLLRFSFRFRYSTDGANPRVQRRLDKRRLRNK